MLRIFCLSIISNKARETVVDEKPKPRRISMPTESVYKIIELVGSSPVSWEEATKNAVNSAGLSLRDLRIAEVMTLDMKIENNQPVVFRARVKLSFKLLSE